MQNNPSEVPVSDDEGLLGCGKGRPTPKSLSKAFGFPAPPPFVELIQTIYDVAGDSDEAEDLYSDLLGLRSGGASARYEEMTPPELFPIGDTGGDGEHYGYILHAPELPSDDFPMGLFVPGVHDGVRYLGRSTREAVENIVAEKYGKALDEVPAGVRKVLSKLRLRIDPSKAVRVGRLEGREWRRVPPRRIPRGYRHVMTSDGVGVLAPAKAFGKHSLTPLKQPAPPSQYLAAAARAIDARAEAAALFYLKEGRDGANVDQENPDSLKDFRKLIALLAKTYRKMGRGLLAKYVF